MPETKKMHVTKNIKKRKIKKGNKEASQKKAGSKSKNIKKAGKKSRIRFGHYLEELFLIALIIINVLAFFELLSPDWDYIKKVLSWTIIGYLLYKVKLSKIFFGHDSKKVDFFILTAYFLLSFKIVLGYAVSMLNDLARRGFVYWAQLMPVSENALKAADKIISIKAASINSTSIALSPVTSGKLVSSLSIKLNWLALAPNNVLLNITGNCSKAVCTHSYYLLESRFFIHRWLNFFAERIAVFNEYSLIAGFLLLLGIAAYIALKYRISKPSLMHVISEEGEPAKSIAGIALRALVILFVFLFFYIAVINLILEWLAFSIDAPIMMLGIFFYLLFWIKHYRRFNTEKLIYKIGNYGEEFYKRLIGLFFTKRGIILGITGMLILHIITDLGSFIVPYITGRLDPLYFGQLSTGSFHNSLFFPLKESLLFSDIASFSEKLMLAGLGEQAAAALAIFCTIYIYIANIAAIVLLSLFPAFLWSSYFNNKKLSLKKWLIALFFSSVVCFFIAPIFKIGRISSGFIGVDITTWPVSSYDIGRIAAAVAFSVLAYFSIASIEKLRKHQAVKSILLQAAKATSIVFFIVYIYYYFTDLIIYYLRIIPERISSGHYMAALILFSFFSLSLIFYSTGIIAIAIKAKD